MTFGTFDVYDEIPDERGVYCNRSLNLRSINAIGYDMDYTLVHYDVEAWEGRAYEHIKSRLLDEGWPVEELQFDPQMVMRGLVLDLKLGNMVKANRFGYIWRAAHGTSVLPYSEMRETYARTLVELSESSRWVFLNTFFSISAGVMYSQLVDLLDRGTLPEVMGYGDLYWRVQDMLDAAHIEGELKAEIMADPEHFVVRDPEMPETLLDQRRAGKKVMLITNSGYEYSNAMLTHTIDPYLDGDKTWRDIFDISVVAARKPDFFSGSAPIFEVVDDRGLLEPWHGPIEENRIYYGGNANNIEECLGMSGDEILYVGDHLFSDVNVTKKVLRWRTALVLREMELEMEAIEVAADDQSEIRQMMKQKVRAEDQFNRTRLAIQKKKAGDPTEIDAPVDELEQRLGEIRDQIVDLDKQLAPMVRRDGTHFNETWGYLMRTGNDKSHLTRQVERYADIYTSRVSNLRRYTPFMFYRAPRGSIPHDPAHPE